MRRLTLSALLLIVLCCWIPARAQTASSQLDGNQCVAQVLKNLTLHGNIDAKLRFESHLYGQKMVGQGTYQQGGEMSTRFTRWEMHTQIADQSASYMQVYDGDHLWTERRLPSRRHISRLDVLRLKAGLRSAARATAVNPREQLLLAVAGQGGLSQMLADLLRNYDFQPPQTTQLEGVPVFSLVGQWRKDALIRHWPGAASLASSDSPDWPQQLPHHVLLMVQQQNLFPRVLEHRTVAGANYATSLSGLRPVRDPLLRYEIHEVNFAVAIDSARFVFNPTERWSDETSLVLEVMKKELEVVEVSAVGEQVSEVRR